MKKQPATRSVPPMITLTSTDGKANCDSLLLDAAADGMLSSISNDLDYLLNRTQEVPTVSGSTESHHKHQQLPTVTPPPPVAFSNQAKSSGVLLKHDVIIEESEHEVDS